MISTSPCRALCVVAAILSFTAPTSSQEVGYIDLTQEAPNPLRYQLFVIDPSCAGSGGGSVGGSEGLGETYPFNLTLLSVDTPELPVGGEMIVLLRLQNVGHDSAFVPWTTSSDGVEPTEKDATAEFVVAELSAIIQSENARVAYISLPVRLYGAKRTPGSTQQIHPREYVELRARLTLDCSAELFQCRTLKPGQAKLSFAWTESQYHETYAKCSTDLKVEPFRRLTSNALPIDITCGIPSH